MKETLCWKCKRPCMTNMCSWMREEKPVDGWNAVPTKLQTSYNEENQDSYLVLKCPEYIPGRKYIHKHRPRPLPNGFLTMDGLRARWKCGVGFVRECIADGMPYERDNFHFAFNVDLCERWMRGCL